MHISGGSRGVLRVPEPPFRVYAVLAGTTLIRAPMRALLNMHFAFLTLESLPMTSSSSQQPESTTLQSSPDVKVEFTYSYAHQWQI